MSSSKFHIAILASGNGSNAEVIIHYFRNHPDIAVSVLMSNNAQAFALERASRLGIPTHVFTREEFKNGEVLKMLQQKGVTHIVLAGFLWLIPVYLIHAFPDRIINIHPALLPKYGGKGMYGMKVHQAVKEADEPETGITIHLVNEHYDDGKILFQGRCAIGPSFAPEKIAQCVHELEYKHYPPVIESWILNTKL